MIKAPYNFVPLAQKIVFPEWASQISIDRPFEDGISGTINVTYTAQTPIFIGNGKKDNNPVIPNYKAANGKYAIPGSSIRGMLRNIIEIASFGKFNRVSDAALSVRDLSPAAKDLYRNYFTNKSVNGGWLCFENSKWVVYPVNYHRVEDSDIESCYNLERRTLSGREESEKRIKHLKNEVEVFFSPGGKKVSKITRMKNQLSNAGYVVLTGNPGGKKHLDFIFENKGGGRIEISYETLLQFKQANASKAADQKHGLDLTKKLNDCKNIGYPGIPVFYLPDLSGKPNSLGLSLMYRLPYKNTLHDAIKKSSENNFSDKLDFAECLFGKIKNTNKDSSECNFSLRGRVQFEDATTDNGALGNQVDTILGNPKPTYYPNYIEQNVDDSNYKTLMDNDVRLRGWKRYPVRNEINPMAEGEEKVTSHFNPLKEKTVFTGKIHFHNLKKEELGALLWAITWGEDKTLSHAVGMGKPYGFGQIKAEISSLECLYNHSDDNEYKEVSENKRKVWMKFFTDYMEKKIIGWGSCTQLNELKEMANPKNAERSGWDLSHMSLKDKNGNNQFVGAKKSSFLAPYSKNSQEFQLANNSNRHGGGHGIQNHTPQKITRSENGIANGSVQICILLEEKTKRGGWKAAVKDSPGISGPITNSAAVPSNKNPGDEIKLKVTAVKENNSNFLYIAE